MKARHPAGVCELGQCERPVEISFDGPDNVLCEHVSHRFRCIVDAANLCPLAAPHLIQIALEPPVGTPTKP
jgi:hypothetical protein